ncbi:hypothetical protein ACWDKQ_22085 [Saccharopolyspora sp. NPDC000995]
MAGGPDLINLGGAAAVVVRDGHVSGRDAGSPVISVLFAILLHAEDGGPVPLGIHDRARRHIQKLNEMIESEAIPLDLLNFHTLVE